MLMLSRKSTRSFASINKLALMSMRTFSTAKQQFAISRKHNYETDATISIDPITGKKIFKKPMTINTELPDDPRPKQRFQSALAFVVFAVGMTAACAGIFNYEKTSSPIMNATMYFLRRSKDARELLGRKITYDGMIPWIHGEVNTMKGVVDCYTYISGDKASAKMILKAEKDSQDRFVIREWTLTSDDGRVVDLSSDASVDLVF
ncbi:hypothetical protein CAS74_004637 [Pichia kudriavzevii]|uniref:Cytochrome c oxidase assembly factor 1 n=1 Tax=Pichia kudriavzevii TaxID=4909 RepID=A0A099P5J8_PICKU|nr:uncharacterized protein C5L36_0B11240 [Pichia kudriavzevii]AWU75889.1 hypothetical protein C5L36_0B11240 [Pichia kudriavzevii]KGK39301.1 hypothetical protein JL09_g1551 [Pichia kudriavzevii]ONH77243.1 Cytochrome c oxidase assembly factor 1 [Pichia kudriavzevii]OUT20389.1 hypothetical protein CAS74_004637 [Pichia kudriavzevii]